MAFASSRADRDDAGTEPQRRSRVQSQAKETSLGQTQASEGPMTARILIGIYLLLASGIIAFQPIAGAAAAPPATQYPGQSCDRWEQECTKHDGPQTDRWYECMNQPQAKYACQDPAGFAGYPSQECDMWLHECARSYGSATRKYKICMQRRAAVVACGRF